MLDRALSEDRTGRSEDGLALITVLAVIAILSILVLEFSTSVILTSKSHPISTTRYRRNTMHAPASSMRSRSSETIQPPRTVSRTPGRRWSTS